MTNKSLICFILPWLGVFCDPAVGALLIHHDLQVDLDPDTQQLRVTDRIELPDNEPISTEFLLHEGLNPRSLTPGVAISETARIAGPAPLIAYRLRMPEERRSFTLEYGGKIAHRLTTHRESPGRTSQRLAGAISAEGVYLDAGSGWYPYFPERHHSFSLTVDLPSPWLAVSQGEGPKIERQGERTRVQWRETSPQDDIYLIAAPYRLYRKPIGNLEAQVFLRQDDAALAERYLQTTDHYLRRYEALIGPYPYAKFALVENFWESGYGMPSFTLLGPRVLRLPFILHTSYPHEILHNWWGNSVYVDYATGNWAEGLTSYLADHLLNEARGQGANHRRTALQRYRDFIRSENDFPLADFRGRHGMASQAVGYDKTLMFFHMLRRRLGDPAFIAGLQDFYRKNRFKSADFADLRDAFEQAGNQSLEDFFHQWTERTGAPALAVRDIAVEKTSAGYRLGGTLFQTQKAPPYPIDVPLVIHQAEGEPSLQRLFMQERQKHFVVELPTKPLQLDVDPWFDLFRQLDSSETPPTLSGLFGSKHILIVLPSKAPKPLLEAYQRLARQWAEGYEDAEVRLDNQLTALPQQRPVWLLGWENSFLPPLLAELEAYPIARQQDSLKLAKSAFSIDDHSFAITHRKPKNGQTIAWVASRSAVSLPGLTRKLPHYGKYSYLAFAGDKPEIRLKGQWPVTRSPLRIALSSEQRLREAPEPGPLVATPR
ncbi:MAG: M1 family peptidase [Candidatus Thiodiazotropha sp. (ex Dulcina madagascariensis)]|nr:M1 family peptidase [Candidatus Thiodiazotropha sp. (ex Dulcina madagascariensis)]MCU7927779.1 M1 family peptidase [Candidatus Thiodiazotropha sp. (ex Dulcina madagascariensis)]